MKRFGKTHCQICDFVDESNTFGPSDHTYFINFAFDFDSEEVVYLIICKKCKKIYVGSNITPFRKRFNNHENSLIRYGKGQRGDIGRVFICSLFWSRT